MPGMGTYGNQNARHKAKVWTEAITEALRKRSEVNTRDALEELAERLISCCLDPDPHVALPALTELGNRLEGKPKQQVEIEAGGSLTELLATVASRHLTAAAPDPPRPVAG